MYCIICSNLLHGYYIRRYWEIIHHIRNLGSNGARFPAPNKKKIPPQTFSGIFSLLSSSIASVSPSVILEPSAPVSASF
jgi:hypothetical protein